jgi:hypothetical protein
MGRWEYVLRGFAASCPEDISKRLRRRGAVVEVELGDATKISLSGICGRRW